MTARGGVFKGHSSCIYVHYSLSRNVSSFQQRRPSRTRSFSAGQELFCLLQFTVADRLSPNPVQSNQVCKIPPKFFTIHFSITVPFTHAVFQIFLLLCMYCDLTLMRATYPANPFNLAILFYGKHKLCNSSICHLFHPVFHRPSYVKSVKWVKNNGLLT